MIFFSSDHHFFHKNIIKYANRPFDFSIDGVYDNAKFMFEQHNKTVKNDDLVFFLGDVALFKPNTSKYIQEMLKAMHGIKILIRGNHDLQTDEFYQKCGFKEIYEYLVFGQIMLCHYPLIDKSKYLDIFKEKNCKLLIHGHTHERNILNNDFMRINVCVEQLNYGLYYNDKIENYINKIINNKKGYRYGW